MSEPHESEDPTAPGWAAPSGGETGGTLPPPAGETLPPPPAGGMLPPPPEGYPTPGYGEPGAGTYPYGAVQAKTPGVVITGFVLALVGILIAGIPLGIAALVCGIVGLSKINASNGLLKGKGLAIAAMVIGPIDVILAIIIIADRNTTT